MQEPKCEYCGYRHSSQTEAFRCEVQTLAERRDGTPIIHGGSEFKRKRP